MADDDVTMWIDLWMEGDQIFHLWMDLGEVFKYWGETVKEKQQLF